MPSRPRVRRSPLLARLGERVRGTRTARGQTLAALADAAGLSRRFLTDVELGKANVSLNGLAKIAAALGLDIAVLVAAENGNGGNGSAGNGELEGAATKSSRGSRARLVELVRKLPEHAIGGAAAHLARLAAAPPPALRFALIGLRGAGKTTIGRRAAERAKLHFVELDQLVESAAGMPLADLFTLHGESYYRQLEREALQRLLKDDRPLLLAVGGGIVGAPDTYELLRRGFVTIWLKAAPEDHWNRVVDQGDQRPMQGQPAAMARLREILAERAPLYGLAHHTIDTAAVGVGGSAARVEEIVRSLRGTPV